MHTNTTFRVLVSKQGMEEERFGSGVVRQKCNYTRWCTLAHIMMLENDKTATALAQNTHISAYTQTKPPAMMVVEMLTYSKQKTDEFPSTRPHDIYMCYVRTWKFLGSTTDNTTWGCRWKNKTLHMDKTISLMCFSSFSQTGFFSMRVMLRFHVGTFIMVLVSSCWEKKLKVTGLLSGCQELFTNDMFPK